MEQVEFVAFVDESGSLSSASERVVVIAAVIAEKNRTGLGRVFGQVRRKLPTKGKRKQEKQIGEFKFYRTGAKTRREVLRALAKQPVTLIVLVVDKQGRVIEDSPVNYARMMVWMLSDCIEWIPTLTEVVLDRRFTGNDQEDALAMIRAQMGEEIAIRAMDSLSEPRIDLADFVAGAVAYAQKHQDASYEDLVRSKIALYQVVKWTEKEKW